MKANRHPLPGACRSDRAMLVIAMLFVVMLAPALYPKSVIRHAESAST